MARISAAFSSPAGVHQRATLPTRRRVTPAERLLDLYHGDWQGDVTRIYRDFAY